MIKDQKKKKKDQKSKRTIANSQEKMGLSKKS